MRPHKTITGILAVIGLSLASAAAIPPAAVEADWIERDALWRQTQEGKTPPFSHPHIRETLLRAEALLDRFAHTPAYAAPALAKQHASLKKSTALLPADAPEADRKALYLKACALKRQIAFSNPLLDFDEILFIKRHHATGEFHMCDQFYGFNAKAGGGLYVLKEPFGATPRAEDLLADSRVASGRLQGRDLASGAFLSPELSFDGQRIAFAWSEAKGDYFEWSPRSSFHIFEVYRDGSGLRQLSDGPWNDFDPCYLPNGRIAFISERRGGFLRCGRHCPTYTLYSMEPDGSDIIPLSYHETHEWQPSVDNEGRIIYTRWDYIDRDSDIAHHLWTCYPDGRDPRSFHGNYPHKRELRPWIEMSFRAIPGSRKYIGVAAAHHGHMFGSLILVDPHIHDDNETAQLTRLTPEIPFPESETPRNKMRDYMVYGQPWPLSEEDFLCVYDAKAKVHGLYWVDAYGNKELLYRDPAIPCMSPIPLRQRPRPAVIPEQTTQTAQVEGGAEATIAIMDIYNGDFRWPEDTKITALRVVQILPKTTGPPNEPRIGIGHQTNARAVLGTVPVEADGSAYFKAPPGFLLYFQALNAEGMAVQSMRSGAYVHPGEQLTCLGCHEHKHRSSMLTAQRRPLALQRPPSSLTPPPEGANPFNYQRLVQPVLDRACVACHEKEGRAPRLDAALDQKTGWPKSYVSLAEDFGFYYNVNNGSLHDGVHGGSRSIPGACGALASPLLPYLEPGHYGVQLSAQERERILLWLDMNSEFLGGYEYEELQARGALIRPSLF